MPQPDGCGIKSPERQRVMHKDHTEKCSSCPIRSHAEIRKLPFKLIVATDWETITDVDLFISRHKKRLPPGWMGASNLGCVILQLLNLS
mgnify:CR=1 FL=1